MHNSNRSVYGCLKGILMVLFALGSAQVSAMDADLNLANRTMSQVGKGLERLRPGDVSKYNRLSSKLNKAAKHLESTQSKNLPEYAAAVKRWGELQAQMAEIAKVWNAAIQQAQAEANRAPPSTRQSPTQNQAQATQQTQPDSNRTPPTARQSLAQTKAQVKPKAEPVDLDPLMTKYQRSNLPKLSDTASASQAREWAEHMKLSLIHI